MVATSPANQGGGYPTADQVERVQLTAKQHQNVIRLTIALAGYGNHHILNNLLGEELKNKCNKNINTITSQRLTSRDSNLKYHMVQEEVEHYDLMVNMRNLVSPYGNTSGSRTQKKQ